MIERIFLRKRALDKDINMGLVGEPVVKRVCVRPTENSFSAEAREKSPDA